jgi:hypothetical protein
VGVMGSNTDTDVRALPTERAVDPYLVWARDTGFRYSVSDPIGADSFLTVVIESKTSAVDFYKWAKPPGSQPLAWVRLPKFYGTTAAWAKNTRFCTAQLRRAETERLIAGDVDEFWEHVKRFELAADVSVNAINPRETLVEFLGVSDRTYAGVIDVGIPFARRDYRSQLPTRSGNTMNRVVALWDQSLRNSGGVTSPAGGYGREWNERFRAEPLLKDFTMTKLLDGVENVTDEELLYRATQWDGVEAATSHGAAVLGEMVGAHDYSTRASYNDKAAQVPVLAVQLPRRTVGYSARASLAAHVLDGLRWMLSNVGIVELLVVTLSLGTHAGPHDGSSIIESAIDDLIEQTSTGGNERLAVVIACGNSRQSRTHARFNFAPNTTQNLQFRVLPDDVTPSFVELWAPVNAVFDVTLTAPDGSTSAVCSAGQTTILFNTSNEIAFGIYRPQLSASGNGQMALIAIAPTVGGAAQHGLYSINIVMKTGSGEIHAWVERDNSMYDVNRPRGRQSYFVDAHYVDAALQHTPPNASDSYIERETTLNSYATGKRTVVVSTIDELHGRPAQDASAGLARDRVHGMRPDVAAPGDESVWAPGVRVAGVRSGAVGRLRGSSVAAPRVARRLLNAWTTGNARVAGADIARETEAAPPGTWRAKPSAELVGTGRVK